MPGPFKNLLKGIIICLMSLGWAQELPLETRIKAAYLYKFCSYVRWPEEIFASSDAPLVIAVLNDALLADELERVAAGRSVAGRKLLVYRASADADLTAVQALYVAGKKTNGDHKKLAALVARPVLTVTELAGGPAPGMINFVKVNSRMRFDISQARAQQAGLGLDSQLLTVARQVLRDNE